MQNGLHGTKFLARLPWWNTCTTPRYSGCIHLKYSLRGAVQVFRYTTVVFSIPLGSPMERQSNRWIKKKNRIGSMDNSCFTWSEEQESCTILEWHKKNTPASSDVSYVWCFVYDDGGCRGVRMLTVWSKFEANARSRGPKKVGRIGFLFHKKSARAFSDGLHFRMYGHAILKLKLRSRAFQCWS